MPMQDDSCIGQTNHINNNPDTPSVTTMELDQDSVSALEVSVDFDNSEISLIIVRRQPLEQPIMTTRIRAASFSGSEVGSELLSLEGNGSSGVDTEHVNGDDSMAAVITELDPDHSDKETGGNSSEEKDFESESEESSEESSEGYDGDHTIESLAETLIRRALLNTSGSRRNSDTIPPVPSSGIPNNRVAAIELPPGPVHLTFFNPPEPAYVLHETDDGVTVDLTKDIRVKFFSVESEEIEDALKKLPTIAQDIRFLTERAQRDLKDAMDCFLWDLSGKKPDVIQEAQELEDESKWMSVAAGLDVQVKFTVTATCFGEKMAEMTL